MWTFLANPLQETVRTNVIQHKILNDTYLHRFLCSKVESYHSTYLGTCLMERNSKDVWSSKPYRFLEYEYNHKRVFMCKYFLPIDFLSLPEILGKTKMQETSQFSKCNDSLNNKN